MELYLTLRSIHITCVVITAAGFLLRGVWMLHESPLLKHRLTRTLPHVNDTFLLFAGIGMAWISHLNPLDHSWLMAKLAGLLAYIIFGSIALRRGRTAKTRTLAFSGALIALGYIVTVALTRSPLPFATWL